MDSTPYIYVASRATKENVARWQRLRDLYHWPIISSWIDRFCNVNLCDLWPDIMCEIQNSTCLVLFVTKDCFPIKGALVEVGAALALGKTVYVIMNNVELDTVTSRPLGSWIFHPNVSLCSSLDALGALLGL